jgi:hypothetical protein
VDLGFMQDGGFGKQTVEVAVFFRTKPGSYGSCPPRGGIQGGVFLRRAEVQGSRSKAARKQHPPTPLKGGRGGRSAVAWIWEPGRLLKSEYLDSQIVVKLDFPNCARNLRTKSPLEGGIQGGCFFCGGPKSKSKGVRLPESNTPQPPSRGDEVGDQL